MRSLLWIVVSLPFSISPAFHLLGQSTAPQPAPAPAQKKSVPKAAPKSTAPAALTNRDVIRLLQAKLSEDIIIAKINNPRLISTLPWMPSLLCAPPAPRPPDLVHDGPELPTSAASGRSRPLRRPQRRRLLPSPPLRNTPVPHPTARKMPPQTSLWPPKRARRRGPSLSMRRRKTMVSISLRKAN